MYLLYKTACNESDICHTRCHFDPVKGWKCMLWSFDNCPSPPVDNTLSNDVCPEDKREDYHNCSVLYCVQQLYTVIAYAHTYTYV